MDFSEVWNDICYHVDKNLYSLEKDYQKTIEFIFEKLGWSMRKGEIESQVDLPIGFANSLRPDIVINHDGRRVLVIELKRANATLSEDNAKQLFSYMRQLRLDFGVLIGESLQLYYDSGDTASSVKFFDVPLKKDSEPGTECISILYKDGFSLDCLKAFYEKCLTDMDRYIIKNRVIDAKSYKPVASKTSDGSVLKVFVFYTGDNGDLTHEETLDYGGKIPAQEAVRARGFKVSWALNNDEFWKIKNRPPDSYDPIPPKFPQKVLEYIDNLLIDERTSYGDLYRSPRLIKEIPEEFTLTDETQLLVSPKNREGDLWKSGRLDFLWKRKGYKYRFVVRGSAQKGYDIFVVVDIEADGRYLIARWFEHSEQNTVNGLEFED